MIIEKYVMDTSEPRYRIWGWKSQEKHYFYEWLPAFFERTLTVSLLEDDACLKWLFTGPRGRVEVILQNNSIGLCQYYTDSYALYPAPPEKYTNAIYTHPERIWMEEHRSLDEISEITVVCDRTQRFCVCINGKIVLEQRCSLELTRHQLWLTGTDVQVEGEMFGTDYTKACFQTNETEMQIMEGFGGIASTLSYQMLSEKGKERWFQYLKEYNLLIQREYPNRGAGHNNEILWDNVEEAVPHYYGNNFPVGEVSDFEYNTKIYEIGGTVWFEFWFYPDFVYDDGKLNPDRLIAQILDYCKTAKKKTGKAPSIVGIQNERCESAEMLEKLVPELRKALDENGFASIKLAMCNASYLFEGKEYLRRFQSSDATWNSIDFSASNEYDYQDHLYTMEEFIPTMKEFKKMAKGKPFLSTELAINRQQFQEDSYRNAFNAGQLFHYNLTELDATAICYCWTLMDVTESSYGFTRTLFTVDSTHGFVPVPSGYILRVFGAFSRHITVGMKRIGMSTNHKDILCSGYKGTTGEETYVFLNQGNLPCKLELENLMKNNKEWSGEICDQYHENDTVELKDSSYLLQPGAIFTLFC